MSGYCAYSEARRGNEVICERCNKGRRAARKRKRVANGGGRAGESGIICGCKKRLIAMGRGGGGREESGQCNAVNAHGRRARKTDMHQRFADEGCSLLVNVIPAIRCAIQSRLE